MTASTSFLAKICSYLLVPLPHLVDRSFQMDFPHVADSNDLDIFSFRMFVYAGHVRPKATIATADLSNANAVVCAGHAGVAASAHPQCTQTSDGTG